MIELSFVIWLFSKTVARLLYYGEGPDFKVVLTQNFWAGPEFLVVHVRNLFAENVFRCSLAYDFLNLEDGDLLRNKQSFSAIIRVKQLAIIKLLITDPNKTINEMIINRRDAI